jgi:hypothetical protein
MNGSLSVSNHKDGAEFTIEFQKGVLSWMQSITNSTKKQFS